MKAETGRAIAKTAVELTRNKRPVPVMRQELYEKVWQVPLKRLAEGWGTSYEQLVSACQVMNVPRPPAGYPNTNGIGATLQATILTEATNGTVIAESVPVVLPDYWDGPSRFVFKEQVLLKTGRTYAIALKVLEGDFWGIRSYGELFPPYPPGRYFINGVAVDSFDIWFRTVVRFTPPSLTLDPSATLRWQGIPSLPYTVWSSPDFANWSNIGIAQSSSRDFSFTNQPPDSRAVFYRISYP